MVSLSYLWHSVSETCESGSMPLRFETLRRFKNNTSVIGLGYKAVQKSEKHISTQTTGI